MRQPLPFLDKASPETWSLHGEVRRAVAEANEAAGVATLPVPGARRPVPGVADSAASPREDSR